MIRLLLLFILSGLFASAQDSTKKVSNFYQNETVILNFTFDNWTDMPSEVESKEFRSRGFSFLLMKEKMNKSGNVGVAAGLGFMSQNVHTNAYILDSGSASYLTPIPDSMELKVNKLSTNFITAAIEFRLRSNENNRGNRFKLSVGFQAGYLVQSHTKYEDRNGKFKTYSIPHLNDFQYGIEGRLGYNFVAINGYYSLVPLFQDGEGPEMTPYSIGVSLTF